MQSHCCGLQQPIFETEGEQKSDHQPRDWAEQGDEGTTANIPLFSEVLDVIPDDFPMIIEFKQVSS